MPFLRLGIIELHDSVSVLRMFVLDLGAKRDVGCACDIVLWCLWRNLSSCGKTVQASKFAQVFLLLMNTCCRRVTDFVCFGTCFLALS